MKKLKELATKYRYFFFGWFIVDVIFYLLDIFFNVSISII